MDRFEIPASEHGVVRVFEAMIDDVAVQKKFFKDDRWTTFLTVGADDGSLTLNDTYIDLIRPADLKGVGLSKYLIEGIGIADDALAEDDAARLDQITRPVVVLLSKAFDGRAATLEVSAPLVWVGTYGEVRASPVQLQTRDVGGQVSPKPAVEDRPTVGKVAVYLGLIFAALFGIVAVLGFARS